MGKKGKKLNRNRHLFLIEQYFDGVEEGYAVRTVGSWVLVKHFNGSTKVWQVAIYTRESYGSSQDAYQKSLIDD